MLASQWSDSDLLASDIVSQFLISFNSSSINLTLKIEYSKIKCQLRVLKNSISPNSEYLRIEEYISDEFCILDMFSQ